MEIIIKENETIYKQLKTKEELLVGPSGKLDKTLNFKEFFECKKCGQQEHEGTMCSNGGKCPNCDRKIIYVEEE